MGSRRKRLRAALVFALLSAALAVGSWSAYAEETATTEPAGGNVLLEQASERGALLSEVYLNTASGSDANGGEAAASAVKTFQRALELVSDGGSIYVDGTILVSQDLSVAKTVAVKASGSQPVVFDLRAKLSMEAGKKLSVEVTGDKTLARTAFSMQGGSLGDGSYRIDLTGSPVKTSLAFDKAAVIEGTSKDALKVEIVDALLTSVTGSVTVRNAAVVQTENAAFGSQQVGTLNLYGADYRFVSPSSKNYNRLRIANALDMRDSSLSIDAVSIPNRYGLILGDKGASKYRIENSSVSISPYGSILADSGGFVASNSTFAVDGIHHPKAKPFPAYFPATLEGRLADFSADSPVRASLSDTAGNSYDYGFPAGHGDEVVKVIPLPAVTLTFVNEESGEEKAFTLVKGNSLEALSGKVKADGVLIDKLSLSDMTTVPADKELKLLIDGDEGKPYSYGMAIDQDTKVVVKTVDKANISGVRYFLNETASDNRYAFVENGSDVAHPLSKDAVQARENWFDIRAKKFKGWSLDREGTQMVDASFAASETGIRELYAQWEDRKAFTVVYYRQTPWYTDSATEPHMNIEKVETTVYEGEHLAGVLADPSVELSLSESARQAALKDGKFFYPVVSDPASDPKDGFYTVPPNGYYGRWHWYKDTSLWDYLLPSGASGKMRTIGWNTQPDGFAQGGTGHFFRGGHELTADDAQYLSEDGKLHLYNQWVDLGWLAKTAADNIADPDKTRPNITLAGEGTDPGDYETAAGALVIDHSQVLDYKAHLDYEPIRKDLVTLWGRINEVTEWSGVMNAYFDSRLEFDQDVPVLFESTWLRPDETKLAEYGVTVKQVEGNPYQWVFTVGKDKITAETVQRTGTDGAYDSSGMTYYKASIPVTMIPKYDPAGGNDFQSLSFEDFMKPMTLTVQDDYGRGINGIVTKESANRIALSDKPVIIVGGDIQMNINGFERYGMTLLKYQLKSNAFDEHAKLYPSGAVRARYELVDFGDYSNKLADLKNPGTDELVDTFEGRAKNENIQGEDPNNYADPYSVGVPSYEKEGYELVGIKVQTQQVDDGGNLAVDDQGNPIVSEQAFSVKDGNLADGKALLAGSFAHDKRITFVMQYAKKSDVTVSIPVEKVWEGSAGGAVEGDSSELPGSVEVKLLADGQQTASLTLSPSADAQKSWKGAFRDVPKYGPDLKEIAYTVAEAGIGADGTVELDGARYAVTVSGDASKGFTITNRAVPTDPNPVDPPSPIDPPGPPTPVEPPVPGDPDPSDKTVVAPSVKAALPVTGDGSGAYAVGTAVAAIASALALFAGTRSKRRR